MIKRLTVFLLALLVPALVFANAPAPDTNFASRSDVQAFIVSMNQKHGFDKTQLTQLFASVKPEPKIIAAISKPFEEVPWYKYRERFVTDERAQAGVQFWKENHAAIQKAEKEYGVPGEIIVSIIGVETYYGRNTGNYPVLQALATLAFDYPPRSEFFKKELEQFLLLTKEENLDPKTVLGSYAGAMGKPQFMPSSYRQYAVDFSDSGRRDLIHDNADVVGSVANYFKRHGWENGKTVAYRAKTTGNNYQKLTKTNAKNPKPEYSLSDLSKYQISSLKPMKASDKNDKTAFLSFKKNDKESEYWLGLQNFYVITRYNHSINYAMAVYQLSEKIKTLKQKD